MFDAVNRLPPAFDPVFLFFSEATKWTPVRIGLLVLFIALLAHKRTRTAAVLAMVAWPVANGFTEAIKNAWPWLRPSALTAYWAELGWPVGWAEALDGKVIVRVNPLGSFGTASSHAANMAAVFVVFLVWARRWAWPWAIVAFMTGLSRLYVGVHTPGQVALGWLCGAVCGLIVAKTWEAYLTVRTRRQGSDRSGPGSPASPEADPRPGSAPS